MICILFASSIVRHSVLIKENGRLEGLNEAVVKLADDTPVAQLYSWNPV